MTTATTGTPMYDLPATVRSDVTDTLIRTTSTLLAAHRATVEAPGVDPQTVLAAKADALAVVDETRTRLVDAIAKLDKDTLRAAITGRGPRSNATAKSLAETIVSQATGSSRYGDDRTQAWSDLAVIEWHASTAEYDERARAQAPTVLRAWAERTGKYLGYGSYHGFAEGYVAVLERVGKTYVHAVDEVGMDEAKAVAVALSTANAALTGSDLMVSSVEQVRLAALPDWMHARSGAAFAVRVLTPAVLGTRVTIDLGIQPELYLLER